MAPRTFQARLTLAFVGVVALTLALVSVLVVNRLDDYFTQQQVAELQGRATLVKTFVDVNLARPEVTHGAPVVLSGNVVNPFVVAYLENADVQNLLELCLDEQLDWLREIVSRRADLNCDRRLAQA